MPKSSIRVFLRVRPTARPSGYFEFDPDRGQVKFDIPLEKKSYLVNNTRTNYKFKFDGLFPSDTTQDSIFETVAQDAVNNALSGLNATIFAYGQTGSGKTFTMTGGTNAYSDRGIIPRCLEYIFKQVEERKGDEFRVFVSYLEIYNGSGMDLLTEDFNSGALEDLPRVKLMEDEVGEIELKNLRRVPVASQEDALNLLFMGDTNRAICETPMNPVSSRSHCIFSIYLESRSEGASVIRRSKLHLVDLAGSERVHKTHAAGQLLTEATNINLSLHYLQQVIVALQERMKKGSRIHVPYRNSVLTSVLRDSLGGNCVTTMVATLNAEPEHTDESVSTCHFAQRVASVSNKAFVNEETDPNVLVRQLKAQMEQKEAEIEFLKGEAGEGSDLTEAEQAELQEAIQSWARRGGEGDIPLGKLTLRRINFAFRCLYDMVTSSGWAPSASSGGATATHGGSLGASAGAGGALPEGALGADEASALQGEVRRLRQQLGQRDHEIAILVGMVKTAQKGGGSRPATGSSHASAAAPNAPTGVGGAASSRPGTGSGLQYLTGGPSPTAAAPAPVVSLPNGSALDPALLRDKDATRQAYMAAHPSAAEQTTHVEQLKAQYTEAKGFGATVNAARGRIQQLKAAVEEKRSRRAMQRIADGDDAQGGAAEGKEGGAEDDPEEAAMVAEIEQHKALYKSELAKARKAKSVIEYTQKLIEAGRTRAAADFERWYAGAKDAMRAVQGGSTPTASASASASAAAPASGRAAAASPRPVGAAAGLVGSAAAPSGGQTVDGVALPAGVKLTGNEHTDREIIAFYRAKEKLMRRTLGSAASATSAVAAASHQHK